MAHNKYFDILEQKRRSKRNRLLEGSPSLISEITKLTISGKPIGLVVGPAYQCFEVKDGCTKDICQGEWVAKYQFTLGTLDVRCEVYNGMLDLDPFTTLDEVTQGLGIGNGSFGFG